MDGSDEWLWLWNFAVSHTLAAVRMHEGQSNHSKIYAFSSSSSSSSFARVFWNWSAVWTELIDMNGINKHEIETALNAMPMIFSFRACILLEQYVCDKLILCYISLVKPNKNGNMCCGAMYGFLWQIWSNSVYLHTKYERKKHLPTCVMAVCAVFHHFIMQYVHGQMGIHDAVHNNNRINLRAQIYSLCEFSGLEHHIPYSSIVKHHECASVLMENSKRQCHFAKVRHVVASSMKRNLIRLNANNWLGAYVWVSERTE